MILHNIESQDRKLRYMFLDVNAYFASVEQQMDPSIRGKPVIVSPVEGDTSCAIAASYEAKKYGIKTGTNVREAKALCPGLIVVHARHSLYTTFHRRIIQAVETVLPVHQVCSIDEMYCRLLGEEREPEQALEIATKVKHAIHRYVGECITTSVGVGPNVFLAKIGTEMQKPDGLVLLESAQLPQKLYSLKLTDFTGINRRMCARLNAAGVFTAEQLCALSRDKIRAAFGSIIGEKWWYMLRGYEVDEKPVKQQTLGHSHVIEPQFRTDEGARKVIFRLLSKAAMRLRDGGLVASKMIVWVRGKEGGWVAETRFTATCDTATFVEILSEMWQGRRFTQPLQCGITFTELKKFEHVTPSLFDNTVKKYKLSLAMDKMNQRFGKNHVYLGSMKEARHSAPERIAFTKATLFKEGRGDHEEFDDLFPEIDLEDPRYKVPNRGWAM